LTSRPSKKIERACLKLGFKIDVSKHHRVLTFEKNGKETRVYTYLSHGNKDYGNRLLSEVAYQLYVSKKNFSDLLMVT